jgi:hypothetical protein
LRKRRNRQSGEGASKQSSSHRRQFLPLRLIAMLSPRGDDVKEAPPATRSTPPDKHYRLEFLARIADWNRAG